MLDNFFFDEIQLSVQSLPDKMNFKIGEAAKILRVKPHVLRYWEEEFSLLRPQKFTNNQRLYFKKDMEILFLIKILLYEEKLTVKGVKQHLTKFYHRWNKEKMIAKNIINHNKQSQVQKKLQTILKEISALKLEIKD